MSTPYTPTKEDIEEALLGGHGYPFVREKIIVPYETSQNFKLDNGDCYPFIRLTAIPERFQETVRLLSSGSISLAIDSARNTFYADDVHRWLRAIGVEAEFVAP
jgi:hypothetical protein